MSSETDAYAGTIALPTDPRLGATVAQGRYRIKAPLGRGGMGAVYEVEQLATGKPFALKTLHAELGRVGEIARRFEREARAASRLSHPGIVSVTDFGELEDGALFLVMEVCRGESLGDRVEAQKQLPPVEALAIARRVLEALAHAHARGVIHRDLKPDNIMLVQAGESEDERDLVKLVDFGIAKVVGEAETEVGGDKLTKAGVAFGTPDYMAPEQALGEPVDARADLYALGAILFETLTGRKPFVSDDKLAVVRMQVSVPAPTLREAGAPSTPAVEALLARALAKRPAERFASAVEMIEALDVAVGSLSPTGDGAALPAGDVAAASRPLEAARSWLRNAHPWIRRGLLAVPLALGVLALIAALSDGPGRGGARIVASAPPAKKSERALAAERRLAAGDLDTLVTSLEADLTTDDGRRDPWAHLVLGHARARLGRDVEALAAYERAVALAAALAVDPVLKHHVAGMTGKREKTVALAALEFLANRIGAPADDVIVELASSGKAKEIRHRALAIAERDGVADRVDRVEHHALDLAQLGSCRERRDVIPKLRALRDKRAIPALEKARRRTGGILGLQDVNDCLARDAAEAIDYLEKLP